jgi:hypothetical protein
MPTELHIIIQDAPDVEELGRLLKQVVGMDRQDKPKPETVVPKGYKCVECYHDDGGHAGGCSIGIGDSSG